MGITPQITPTSTAGLLTCLGLAIDETKLVRSINESREVIKQLESEDPFSHRLLFLNRKLSNLETKLVKTRHKASRMKTVIHLSKFK